MLYRWSYTSSFLKTKETMWTLSVHRLEDGTRAQCHPFAQLALLVNLHPGFAVCYLHLGCSRSKRGQCFLAYRYHADHSPSRNARSLDSCCMSHTHMAYSMGLSARMVAAKSR